MIAREQYSIKSIFDEIPGTPDGAGVDVSLTDVYDKIRDARFEEDDRLSLGIWERDLKKANWPLVEKLSFEALTNKTKDMQILGWFVESLALLDGFGGILSGINILCSFIDLFWHSSYPRNENNLPDAEQKLRILDWIYETLGKRSLFMQFPLNNEYNKINLYDYEYAAELKKMSSRSPNEAGKIIENAKKNGIKTIEEIRNIIDTWSEESVSEVVTLIDDIRLAKKELENVMSKVLKENDVGVFTKLTSNLSKIESLIAKTKKNTTEVVGTVSSDNYAIKHDRNKIYDDIKMLAKELKVIEKHSPSYYILELVVSWKEKGLLEIIDDLKSGTSESHKLLKLLMN
jgi:type VI secretion system ImpA family protein